MTWKEHWGENCLWKSDGHSVFFHVPSRSVLTSTLNYLACCAGVFFGRPNVFAREHAMLKLQKAGGNGVSQREWEVGEEREEKTTPRKSCENEKHPLISRA